MCNFGTDYVCDGDRDPRREKRKWSETNVWEGFTRISLELHLVAKNAASASVRVVKRVIGSRTYSAAV